MNRFEKILCNMNYIQKIILQLLLLLFSPVLFAQSLVILYTNDVHSNIEPAASGEYTGVGGYQRIANYIDHVRANHPNVILLDAGDYNQGTPYYTLFRGELEVKIMNTLKYDAAAIGNHEFDDGQQVFADRLKNATYRTLCSNYDFSKSPLNNMIEPYIVIERGGKRIGIIGATLNIDGVVAAAGRKDIVYKPPIPIVNKLAKNLKKREKCDLVILLSHLGYGEGSTARPGDILVAKKSKDIDIIIGGHTHTYLATPATVSNQAGKPVIITQTGSAGVNLGRLDITF